MGLYGVLGEYDFVTLIEAPDNEAAARFSLEFGVRVGVHVPTLPAIPIGRCVEEARRLQLDDSTLAAYLHGNAARLFFGLDG